MPAEGVRELGQELGGELGTELGGVFRGSETVLEIRDILTRFEP